MLGFFARADYGELEVNPRELEDARWYTRSELKSSPENEVLRLSRRDSISRRLIDDWIAGG
jgi:NAD+ diphosphatase